MDISVENNLTLHNVRKVSDHFEGIHRVDEISHLDHRRISRRTMTGTKTPEVDPAFRTISKSSTAFIIWRVENFKLVPVPKDQYGLFYEGDSYIVYAASEYGKYIVPGMKSTEKKGRLEMHIHFWLGATTSQDESAVAAYKTVELDDHLGGICTQHREVQGQESTRFLAYFSSGIRTLKGGVQSALNHVISQFEPRLFRVKGRRYPVIRQMPAIKWEHMNKGDVFIIDTKDVVFIWIGRSANNMEKLQAIKVATQLKDEHNAVSIVFVDDGKEEKLLESERMLLGVYLDLSASARASLREATDDDGKVETKERSALKLYKCSDEDGTYKVVEVKTGPLLQTDLNTNDSFIIDNGANGIWVWIGRHASAKERVEAMRNAHGFIMKKNYPSYTHISRVVEGGEPTEFKALFLSWKEKEIITNINNINKMPVKAKVVTMQDATTLHESPRLAAESQLVDDGSGTTTVWRVVQSELELVPKPCHGTFYAGDCYLVKYSYFARGQERHILYYWLGLHSSVTEQTALALHTVAQDDALGGAAVQVRVVQSKEPPHFLAIFHGKMVVMSGDHRDWYPDNLLIQVRGNQAHNTRATQVVLKASSLNSNDVFVLRNGSSCYVWCGKGSTGDEREMAKKIAGSLTKTEFSVVYEGQEKTDFWTAIGGKESYADSKRLAETENTIPARLFHCSNATGVFKVEEMVNFTQVDLVPDDVMLLDTWDAIFLWIGQHANREEKKQSITLAFNYLRTDPAGRDPDTPILQIKQGFEPPNFTGFFGVWDPDLWNEYKPFAEQRKELESQKPVLQVELKITNGVQDFEEYEKFPIDVLKEKDPEKLPLNVDATRKELHLSRDDFSSTFGMSFEHFNSLPKWRQDNLKKKVGVF
ncbi:villin-1-like isoform X2 [Macrosteles quadrilineatus]|uniref:villin-1-like isoform X2 n=1 Tax=Macrosteles quadrilineatus TaxID=74068 RepID=UPI0023E32EF6|nr:villin-1-like isoform X2 [Macrosteles quadrilineatus]